MGSNRRLGTRNRFTMIKDYKVPLVCVLITCVLLVISTITIISLVRQNNYYKTKLNELDTNNTVVIGENTDLPSKEKIQINELMTYILSNLNAEYDLNNEQAKYEITCKYFAKENKLNTLNEEYIDKIDSEVYRKLGYVYFDDYKDTYTYISKTDFDKVYSQLFNSEKQDKSILNQYYISEIDSYITPKNTKTNENTLYKLTKSKQDTLNKNTYEITLAEINLYKLYEQMEYAQIVEYKTNEIVDEQYLTGKKLIINMIKQNEIFVFDSYTN